MKCYPNALITLISKNLESTWPRTRDGHNTDTKYRYCRHLRVRVKYRCFQVSLVFDTKPVLFMVSMYVSIKAKKKLKMRIFFLEVCLMNIKSSVVFPIEFSTVV